MNSFRFKCFIKGCKSKRNKVDTLVIRIDEKPHIIRMCKKHIERLESGDLDGLGTEFGWMVYDGEFHIT